MSVSAKVLVGSFGPVIAGLLWLLWTSHVPGVLPIVAGEKDAVPVTSVLLPETVLLFPKSANRDVRPARKIDIPDPVITSESVIVVDNATDMILWQKNADHVRPLASLTKLVTAMTFLEYRVPLDALRALTPEENRFGGSRIEEQPGEHMRIVDLFYAVLVGSTNNGALSLAHSTGVPESQFVERMNTFVQDMGLSQTHFVEPTGLSEANVSTAQEWWRVLRYAARFPEITKPLLQKEHFFETIDQHHLFRIVSTNELLNRPVDVILSKTGFIREAGYCLGTVARTTSGKELTIVILGAPTSSARFDETEYLVQWAESAFSWDGI